MKPGRNDPCQCGSGKKFKKCCLDKEPLKVPPEVLKKMRKQVLQVHDRNAIGDFLPYPHTEVQGERAVGLRGQILYRPLNESFHEFTMIALLETLGRDWLNEQQQLEDKHYIAECFEKYEAWKINNAKEKLNKGRFQALPDGYARYVGSLAYDVTSLLKTKDIPESLIRRLKDPDQFQGARYEIAIAAIMSRLGFEIEFLEVDGQKEKHCEFYATHQEMNVDVAVEAKSRHRAGVLHYPGIREQNKLLKRDFNSLINRALKKKVGDRLFLIFIDANVPQTPTFASTGPQWFKDVKNTLEALFRNNKGKKPAFDSIFITNFSFHYQEDQPAEISESAFFASNKLQKDKPEMIKSINTALTHYGTVPHVY